ncbi:hypothetical protein SCANM124S_03519 [Streptomyces canus]
MKSLDVKVWAVRKRDTKTPSYGVRWSVAGNVFSESFRTKALADHYRTKLMRAIRDGEEFDAGSGLPASMEVKKSAVSWYAFALRYLAMKWPHAAPNTRDGINESLTSVTVQLLDDRAGRPSDEAVRKALRNWAFVLPGLTIGKSRTTYGMFCTGYLRLLDRSPISLSPPQPVRSSTR